MLQDSHEYKRGVMLHARSDIRRRDNRIFRGEHRLCGRVRSAQVRCQVVLDYGISVLVSAALLVYLTVALLKPEKF
jgi:K+-transporting ATPase KdpF subunit